MGGRCDRRGDSCRNGQPVVARIEARSGGCRRSDPAGAANPVGCQGHPERGPAAGLRHRYAQRRSGPAVFPRHKPRTGPGLGHRHDRPARFRTGFTARPRRAASRPKSTRPSGCAGRDHSGQRARIGEARNQRRGTRPGDRFVPSQRTQRRPTSENRIPPKPKRPKPKPPGSKPPSRMPQRPTPQSRKSRSLRPQRR